MPTYTLRNTETGEIFDHSMKISEYDAYMAANPHIQRHHTSEDASLVDPATLGIVKPPSDFQKYVVGGIQQRNPGAARGSKFGAPKEW